MEINLRPIGFVRGGRTEPINDEWDSVTSRIELDTDWLSSEAVMGLNGFSHVEVTFHFHETDPKSIVTTSRHPQDNKNFPLMGIFAQRVHLRPNLLGMTTCHVLGVEGASIHVRGLDALDGTPVLDIKPFMVDFGPRGDVREPGWVSALMSSYWEKKN
jgi:tRNA-Thr(GGU) m(6)t(6)A37 methyltransferase TsaA